MRRASSAACLVAALLLSAVRPALAVELTGRIEGTVYDDQGMPLGGARVTATSPTQIGGVRSAVTGPDGNFRFVGLIPGVFTVTVRAAGFVSSQRSGIRVNADKTVTLDLLLDRPAAPPPGKKGEPGRPARAEEPAAETYVITAARPVVDVTRPSVTETVSDEYAENVPVLSRSYQSLTGLTRNVAPSLGGGSGNPAISGGAYFNNSYTVDGMETTDPVTHTFSTNFNFDAMADVNVMTGGMGPEFSDTPGGVVNMVTKSGSNKLELDGSLYYQDAALTIRDPEEKGSTFRTLDVNLNVGGPILRDRLWYYTSFELNESVSTLPPDPNRLMPDHPSRRYFGIKYLGKLTWQPHPRHRLIFWAQTSPASIANTRQQITYEPDAETHQNQYNALATTAWELLASEKLFVKTQLGFGWNGLRIAPESGVTDISQIQDVGTGVYARNGLSSLVDDRYRVSINSDATYFWNRFGEHEVKGGFRFQHLRNPSQESYSGNELRHNQFGQPYSLTRYFLAFDEASACDPGSPLYDPQKCMQGTLATTVSGNKLVAFLQDSWKLPRYKRLRIIPGAALHFGNAVNPDGETVTSFVTGTPHLNFAWDLFGNGRTVVRGGYNQYVDMGFLALARFIGRDLVSYDCDYDESTGTYTRNCRVGGQIRTVGMPAGPGFDAEGKPLQKFNPDALTPPRVHELTFGAEREWLTGFSTGLDFQLRYYRNQWEDVETNVIWNELGDSAVGFRSGKSEFIYDLETPEQAYRRYVSLSLFARRFVGNWQLMASYTWSRTEGTVAESDANSAGYATTFLDRPRQVQFFDGYLPSDRRHQLKLTGWYSFRKVLTVGGSLWLGTGTPYERYFYNSFFRDYNDRRAPRGMNPNDLSTPYDDTELRLPTQLTLDIKVTWRLTHLTRRLLGEAHNLELIAEIFNLLNLRTATAYEERDLKPGAPTQWGDIINKLAPFRARFGLRYRY